jgi:hypothetical protein
LTLAKKVSATFYIYSDGVDIEETAPAMRARIEDFVSAYNGRVRLVDQREEKNSDWEFGVNFEADMLADAEKKDLLLFFQALSAEFGRDFAVGLATQFRQGEDLAFVSASEPLEPVIEVLLESPKKG